MMMAARVCRLLFGLEALGSNTAGLNNCQYHFEVSVRYMAPCLGEEYGTMRCVIFGASTVHGKLE